MRITTVGNAGIYLEAGGHTFLIDGIYGVNEFFRDRPAEILRAARGDGNRFRNIEFLLFSHRHQDHFDAFQTERYLQNNKVKQVYIPKAGNPGMPYEDTRAIASGRYGTSIIYVEGGNSKSSFHRLGRNVNVAFFRSHHMGEPIFDITHYCPVLNIGEESFIFLGDADTTCPAEKLLALTVKNKVKGVFINPLAYADSRSKAWLRHVSPEHVFIYHIPRTERGEHGLRKLAEAIKDFGQTERERHVLSGHLQTIDLFD